jgi:hypothetical protein
MSTTSPSDTRPALGTPVRHVTTGERGVVMRHFNEGDTVQDVPPVQAGDFEVSLYPGSSIVGNCSDNWVVITAADQTAQERVQSAIVHHDNGGSLYDGEAPGFYASEEQAFLIALFPANHPVVNDGEHDYRGWDLRETVMAVARLLDSQP